MRFRICEKVLPSKEAAVVSGWMFPMPLLAKLARKRLGTVPPDGGEYVGAEAAIAEFTSLVVL